MDFNPYAPPSEAAERNVPQVAAEGELASPLQRLAAKLLDVVCFAVLAAPGITMVEGYGIDDAAILIFALPGLLSIVQWSLIAARGQTIGKRALGLRIVTSEGQPVGFVRGVLLREWVMKIGGLVAYGMPLMIDPFFIFGPTRRCLHDHLAGTRVVVIPTAS